VTDTAELRVTDGSFDHHSEEHAANAECIYQTIRENGGVARSDMYGGYYVLTRYEDVTAAARDHDTFSSDRDQNGPGSGGGGLSIPPNPATSLSLDELDPPAWKRVRSALSPHFAPGAIEKRRASIAEITTFFIDQFIENGSADLVLDLANAVPAIVTLDLLGFPRDNWEQYADPIHKMVYMRRDHPEFAETYQGLAWILEQIRARTAELRLAPGDDMVSSLIKHDGSGTPFSDVEIEEAIFIALAGGVDTTTALMSNTFYYLAENPDERQRLLDDPSLIDSATQEFLRVFTPVQALARTVAKPISVNGVEMHKGDRVLLAWASANRDAEQFPNPDDVEMDRFPNRHCTFGMGIHRCLGSNLARVQYMIVLQEVLRRLPDYELVPGQSQRYKRIGTVNGWERIPVTFTRGKREGAATSLLQMHGSSFGNS
jgi:cytochrome P450